MDKAKAILGSALFFLAAPGVVAGLVPWWISRWEVRPALLGLPLLRGVGGLLVAAGLLILIESFARFAVKGIGTPAPVAPTRHLVVSGTYRFVRNPMYVAVAAIIFGQGLIFGSLSVLAYGLAIWLVFHLFILGYEEPTLQRTYGAEYAAYRSAVPRWIPRVTPARSVNGS